MESNLFMIRRKVSTPTPDSSEDFHLLEALDSAVDSHLSLGKPRKAADCMNQALKIRTNLYGDSSKEVINYLSFILKKTCKSCSSLIETEKLQDTIELLRNLLLLSSNYPLGQIANETCEVYNTLACALRKQSKPKLAKKYALKALGLANSFKASEKLSSSIYLNLCAIYSSLSKHREAADYCNKAIQLAQEDLLNIKLSKSQENCHEEVAVLAVAYHNLGVEEEYLKNYEIALSWYKKAIKFLEKHASSSHFAMLEEFKKSYEDAQRSCKQKYQSIHMNRTMKDNYFFGDSSLSEIDGKSLSFKGKTQGFRHKFERVPELAIGRVPELNIKRGMMKSSSGSSLARQSRRHKKLLEMDSDVRELDQLGLLEHEKMSSRRSGSSAKMGELSPIQKKSGKKSESRKSSKINPPAFDYSENVFKIRKGEESGRQRKVIKDEESIKNFAILRAVLKIQEFFRAKRIRKWYGEVQTGKFFDTMLKCEKIINNQKFLVSFSIEKIENSLRVVFQALPLLLASPPMPAKYTLFEVCSLLNAWDIKAFESKKSELLIYIYIENDKVILRKTAETSLTLAYQGAKRLNNMFTYQISIYSIRQPNSEPYLLIDGRPLKKSPKILRVLIIAAEELSAVLLVKPQDLERNLDKALNLVIFEGDGELTLSKRTLSADIPMINILTTNTDDFTDQYKQYANSSKRVTVEASTPVKFCVGSMDQGKAALVIQKNYKAKEERRKFLTVKETWMKMNVSCGVDQFYKAVMMIQRCLRGWKVRRDRKERIEAENNAAVKIQAGIRGWKVRKTFPQIVEEKVREKEVHQATVKIQKKFRERQARKANKEQIEKEGEKKADEVEREEIEVGVEGGRSEDERICEERKVEMEGLGGEEENSEGLRSGLEMNSQGENVESSNIPIEDPRIPLTSILQLNDSKEELLILNSRQNELDIPVKTPILNPEQLYTNEVDLPEGQNSELLSSIPIQDIEFPSISAENLFQGQNTEPPSNSIMSKNPELPDASLEIQLISKDPELPCFQTEAPMVSQIVMSDVKIETPIISKNTDFPNDVPIINKSTEILDLPVETQIINKSEEEKDLPIETPIINKSEEEKDLPIEPPINSKNPDFPIEVPIINRNTEISDLPVETLIINRNTEMPDLPVETSIVNRNTEIPDLPVETLVINNNQEVKDLPIENLITRKSDEVNFPIETQIITNNEEIPEIPVETPILSENPDTPVVSSIITNPELLDFPSGIPIIEQSPELPDFLISPPILDQSIQSSIPAKIISSNSEFAIENPPLEKIVQQNVVKETPIEISNAELLNSQILPIINSDKDPIETQIIEKNEVFQNVPKEALIINTNEEQAFPIAPLPDASEKSQRKEPNQFINPTPLLTPPSEVNSNQFSYRKEPPSPYVVEKKFASNAILNIQKSFRRLLAKEFIQSMKNFRSNTEDLFVKAFRQNHAAKVIQRFVRNWLSQKITLERDNLERVKTNVLLQKHENDKKTRNEILEKKEKYPNYFITVVLKSVLCIQKRFREFRVNKQSDIQKCTTLHPNAVSTIRTFIKNIIYKDRLLCLIYSLRFIRRGQTLKNLVSSVIYLQKHFRMLNAKRKYKAMQIQKKYAGRDLLGAVEIIVKFVKGWKTRREVDNLKNQNLIIERFGAIFNNRPYLVSISKTPSEYVIKSVSLHDFRVIYKRFPVISTKVTDIISCINMQNDILLLSTNPRDSFKFLLYKTTKTIDSEFFMIEIYLEPDNYLAFFKSKDQELSLKLKFAELIEKYSEKIHVQELIDDLRIADNKLTLLSTVILVKKSKLVQDNLFTVTMSRKKENLIFDVMFGSSLKKKIIVSIDEAVRETDVTSGIIALGHYIIAHCLVIRGKRITVEYRKKNTDMLKIVVKMQSYVRGFLTRRRVRRRNLVLITEKTMQEKVYKIYCHYSHSKFTIVAQREKESYPLVIEEILAPSEAVDHLRKVIIPDLGLNNSIPIKLILLSGGLAEKESESFVPKPGIGTRRQKSSVTEKTAPMSFTKSLFQKPSNPAENPEPEKPKVGFSLTQAISQPAPIDQPTETSAPKVSFTKKLIKPSAPEPLPQPSESPKGVSVPPLGVMTLTPNLNITSKKLPEDSTQEKPLIVYKRRPKLSSHVEELSNPMTSERFSPQLTPTVNLKRSTFEFAETLKSLSLEKIILKTGYNLSGFFVIVTMKLQETGVYVQATSETGLIDLDLFIKTKRTKSATDKEIEDLCSELLAQLKIVTGVDGKMRLALIDSADDDRDEVMYRRSHFITNRYLTITIFENFRGVFLIASENENEVFHMQLGKRRVGNSQKTQEELVELVKRLKVQMVLGQEMLVLST